MVLVKAHEVNQVRKLVEDGVVEEGAVNNVLQIVRETKRLITTHISSGARVNVQPGVVLGDVHLNRPS